ncbi:MAG: hypothetical protein HQ568_02500 [Calditrichaeota bacterium]|nr:hypothetical protein [Calditrichota bacterium]
MKIKFYNRNHKVISDTTHFIEVDDETKIDRDLTTNIFERFYTKEPEIFSNMIVRFNRRQDDFILLSEKDYDIIIQPPWEEFNLPKSSNILPFTIAKRSAIYEKDGDWNITQPGVQYTIENEWLILKDRSYLISGEHYFIKPHGYVILRRTK